jgi:hypothetical protein
MPPNGFAARAANLGTSITLASGERITLRYTMRGLARIEDTVGPLGTIQDTLGGGDKPMIRPLVALIAAGLDDPRFTPDGLLDALDVSLLNEYASAIAVALETAMPAPPQDAPNPPTPQDAQATGSPGATSSSQPPAGESGSPSSGTT